MNRTYKRKPKLGGSKSKRALTIKREERENIRKEEVSVSLVPGYKLFGKQILKLRRMNRSAETVLEEMGQKVKSF